MNGFCLIFADNYKNYDLEGLIKNRSLASLPVACRYRIVDFILSLLVKADVADIGILTTNNYNSLMDHVGWGKDWNLNRKNGGLKIIPPLAISDTGLARNKFEALSNASQYMEGRLQDYCIIADSNIICNIDFKDLLRYHEENNADVTVAVVKRKPEKDEIEMILDNKNRAYDSLYHKDGADYECNTLLKITIMHKDFLNEIIKKGITLGWEDIVRDYISKNFNRLNVYAYEVKGYCKVINSLESYYDFHMDLLDERISKEIFLSGTEILTRVRDSVPTSYGKNSSVSNSILADGCHINGRVENSVIFRDVTIEEGVELKNCIVMSSTTIKEGAKLEYVITDKEVLVTEGKELKGDRNCQCIVPKKKTI